MARNAPWSELLPEILLKIRDDHGLSPIDWIRIRWICSSWRSIAAQNPHKNPFTPLLLALRRTPAGGQELRFFNFLRRSFINRGLPNSLRGHRCCGCFDGWLIMVSDSALRLSLYHPISCTQISLPSEPQCFLGSKYEHPPICRVKNAILSAPPTDCNSIIAAMTGFNIILLCRPGHTEWTVFEGPLDSSIIYIIFHKDQLCALETTGRLTVITLDSQLRGTINSVVQPLPLMGYCSANGPYLIEAFEPSGSALLAVIRRYTCPSGMKFLVFKMEGDKWIPWKCPSDLCLFVGGVRCEAITTNEIRDVKANCVFFTSKVVERVAPNGVGVFFFEGHRVEPIVIPSDAGWCSLFEPVWVKLTFYA